MLKKYIILIILSQLINFGLQSAEAQEDITQNWFAIKANNISRIDFFEEKVQKGSTGDVKIRNKTIFYPINSLTGIKVFHGKHEWDIQIKPGYFYTIYDKIGKGCAGEDEEELNYSEKENYTTCFKSRKLTREEIENYLKSSHEKND